MSFFFTGQVGSIFDNNNNNNNRNNDNNNNKYKYYYGFHSLLISGTLLFSGGLFLTSFCSKYYQFFLSFSLCVGLGSALLMTPQIAIIGHWFKEKRATAIGIATVGGSLGGVLFPLSLRWMYSSIGYSWAIRVISFVSLGLLIMSMFLMKQRKQTVPVVVNNNTVNTIDNSNNNNIEDHDNDDENNRSTNSIINSNINNLNNNNNNSRQLERTRRRRGNNNHKLKIQDIFDWKSLRDPRFAWLVIANFLGELGAINGLTFLASYALAHGHSETMSYGLLVILNSTAMFGRVLPGIVADRILGRYNTLIALSLMATFTIFVLWLPFGHISAVLVLFAAAHGFCNGAIVSLGPVCCGQICKTKEYGRRYGTMYLVASFTVLIGVPLSSTLITTNADDYQKNYQNLIIFNGSVYIGSAIALVVSRYYAVGFRWCKW